MSHWKIGFHCGPAGNPSGIGKPSGYMPTLDKASKPFSMMSVDEYGFIFESWQYNTTDKHVRVFRIYKYSVPLYAAEPKVAAAQVWQGMLADLPQEFDKGTWLAVYNEPDHTVSNWLGEVGYEVGQLALRDGYKVALFGFSSGEPDYDDWETPGMLKFIELAGQHPDQVAVCLHEYSFTVDHLLEDPPYYLIGRFQQLFDVCDAHGLKRPPVIIKEFGWEYRNVPTPAQALPQLKQAADLYAKYPEVLCANIWYLGGGFGSIDDQTQRLIAPVTNAALTYVPPEPPPEPPPDDDRTLYQFLWDMSIDRQIECGISLNPDALLQSKILEGGRTPVHTEDWKVYPGDDLQYAYMGGEDPGGKLKRAVYAARVPEPGKPWVSFSFTDPYEISVPPGDITLKVFPTDYKTITQAFGVNKQNYDMYCDGSLCLQGHNGLDISAPLGTPYYAAAGGTVVWASNKTSSGALSDYGYHIKIASGDYTIVYGHAASNLQVKVGDIVQAGKIIAYSGNTGRSTGPHLHFEMRKCPGLPGWPWCTINPTPFIEPLMEPITPVGIDMKPYFQVVESGYGPFFVLQHQNGITEDIQTNVPDGTVYVNKGHSGQYEHIRVTAAYVERREDTSHSASTLYTLNDNDGSGWSKWAPRKWKKGDAFFRNPVVTVMDHQCKILSRDQVGSWLVFDNFYSTWTSPSNIQFKNVIEMSFRFAPDGEKLEIYKIAPNLGPYAEWRSSSGGHSWVSEIPQGRQPLSSNIIQCLG